MAGRWMAGKLSEALEEPTRVLRERASTCSATHSAAQTTTASNSASTLLSTLAPVGAFALVWLLAFIFLRRRFERYYQPRTFLGSLRENERTPRTSNTLFGWVKDMYSLPDTYILNHHSLDAYLFLRFLKVAVVSCIVGCCITWPVLFPVNATGSGGHKQLDILTFANVAKDGSPKKDYFRYYAHAGCAIIFFSFLMWQITRECIFYINLRQAYFMSPLYASRLSSRTVLFTSVPEHYMDVNRLRGVLGTGVRRIWLATDNSDLEDLVEQRDKASLKLEAAETKLIVQANKNKLKADKKAAKKGDRTASEDPVAADGGESGSTAAQWLDQKKRPTHRLGPLGLIGTKVDSIDWARGELKKLIPQIEQEQEAVKAGEAKRQNSAFVEFATLTEAQSAYQSLTHHQILHMSPRFIGMTPPEVIWSNLRIKWWERVIRQIVTLSAVVATIIFWSIPVAFVGAISQVNYLTCIIPALGFINDIPQVVLGVVTGLLPSILLAVLMALLPIYLRLMAKIGGDPTNSAVELTVQNYYFAFQVVQVFLVATLGSAAASSVQSIIENPTSVTSLLANKLPLASNFYLSYFILQGLGVFSSMLVGLTGLVLMMVFSKFFDGTARKKYSRWITLSGLGWGTVFPIYTNLFVIGICYACIAPLVLAFAAIGLYLFYFAYRYNFLYVSNMNIDTKGRVYPRALQQVFVGIYVAEVCLIGLFAIALGSSVEGAIGPFILMILMLIFTALYNISLNSALGPLIDYLPKSLEYEERGLLEEEGGHIHHEDASHMHSESYDGTNNSRPAGAPQTTNGATQHDPEKFDPHNTKAAARATDLGPAPHKKPGLFAKWLRPDKYCDYATMRRLVPRDIDITYPPEVEEEAYFNPAVTSRPRLLWIPRDPLGISRQEVRDTSEVTTITDEAASLDAKGNILWDHDEGRPPIYEEAVYY